MKEMKPVVGHVAADEMFPEGLMDLEESGSNLGILLVSNEKHVHSDFYNDFEDLFDDDDDLPLSNN